MNDGLKLLWIVLLGACESGMEDPPLGETTGGETTSATSSPTTSAGTSSSGGSAEGGGEGGQLPPADDCESAADCVLDDDCCHCFAYAELPPTHECELDPVCEATECAQMFGGLEPELACVDGNCVLAKIDCDPAHAACDEPPPECSAGQRPAVVDGCWGPCLSTHLCSGFLYPGATCPPGTFELRWSECAGDACGSAAACEPIIEGCDAVATCACGVEAVCAAYEYSCYDDAAGAFCCAGDSSICTAAG